jgi:Domain of unknown function (DUF3846)
VITAIVIPTDSREPVRLEQIDRNDLGAYRRLVSGNLEVARLDRPPASLYFNEEGKLLGYPINLRATTLLWVHNSDFRGRDVIAGPAFIVGAVNRLGDDKTAPEDLIDLLLHTKRYRVQMLAHGSDQWRADDVVITDWTDAYTHGIHIAHSSSVIAEVRAVPELDDELRRTWFQLGRENSWIREASDPPFLIDSFVGCYSVHELEQQIGRGNWSIGTAFYYRDLSFINQVDGGDEWLTIRHGIAFESITFGPSIENGSFASLVRRLLAASKEQCQELTY